MISDFRFKKYKKTNLQFKQSGAAVLLTIVIIAIAVLIMAYSASVLGLGELDLGFIYSETGEAVSLSNSCIEEAMRQLRLDSNYTGGTLTISPESCIISVSGSGSTKTITAISTVGVYHKKIQAIANLSGSNTAITSWQESSE